MANIIIVLFIFCAGIYGRKVCKLLYYIRVNFLSKTALEVVVRIIIAIVLTF